MARQRKQPESGKKRQRVVLSGGEGSPASLWATVEGDAVTLDRDYPDFKPAPGWLVEAGGRLLVIDTVDGVRLNCRQQ